MQFFRDWLERFVAVQGIDRAMAIAAQAYSAFLPLLIVYASLLPRTDNKSFADAIVKRFELSGSTAASVQQAFAPSGAVESGVTALGILLLLVSALAFTRGLQRLYELAFGLPTLGVRNTLRALLWLAVVAAILTLRPVVSDPLDGWLLVASSIATGTVTWLLTPYLLLGRRKQWRALVPQAALTAVGLTALGVWTALYMPHAIGSSRRATAPSASRSHC